MCFLSIVSAERESEEGGLGLDYLGVGVRLGQRVREDSVIFVFVIVSRGIHSPVTIMFAGNIYFIIKGYFWEEHFLCEI